MSTQRVRNVRSAQIRRLAVSLLSATRVQRGININHNETVLRRGIGTNHNETVLRAVRVG